MSSNAANPSPSGGHALVDEYVNSSADEGPSLDLAEGSLTLEKLAVRFFTTALQMFFLANSLSVSDVVAERARSECLYETAQKPRTKRQRTLVSNVFESRFEHISQKIDDLAEMMTRLGHGQQGGLDGQPQPASTSRPASSEAPSRAAARTRQPSKRRDAPVSDHEFIDSSLFSHAVTATQFLEETVDADLSVSNVAIEMKTVLDTLRSAIDSQKRQNDASEQLHPFDNLLPADTRMSDLPIPPLDKIMACLRVAREHQRVLFFWPHESSALGDFTEYVIKVCSPGPVTDADLIIVHTGLHWLFSECSGIMIEDEAKQDFRAQAMMTMDYIYAMYMATIYCFHRSKPFVAWDFICKASLTAQGLGLHSKLSMASETPEGRRRKSSLFWAVYTVEKTVSLRLARASTIHDHDITIPRPETEARPNSVLQSKSVNLIDVASLYGRLYDELFSSSALSLPIPIRMGRAKALAGDWEQIVAKRAEYYNHLERDACGYAEPVLLRFIMHADSASDHAMLTAIHRCMPLEHPHRSGVSRECLSLARISLQEHVQCITQLSDETLHSIHLDLRINGGLLLIPFVPFNIIFCNIIETVNRSDLKYLQALVEALEVLAKIPRYSGRTKQLRIFGALFNVASKYVEIKAKTHGLGGSAVSQVASMHVGDAAMACPATDFQTQVFQAMPLDGSLRAMQGGIESEVLPDDTTPSGSYQQRLGVLENEDFNDFGMELDPLGAQVGSWFQESNDMMNYLLDD